MIVTKQKACRWNDHQRLVLHAVDAKWQIYQNVALNIFWKQPCFATVFAKVSYQSFKTSSIKTGCNWCVNSRVGLRMGLRRKIRYVLSQNVTTIASLKFTSLLLAQPAIVNTLFNIDATVSVSRDIRYHTCSTVIECRNTQWVDQSNPCAKSTKWIVCNLTNIRRTALWNEISICALEGSSTWNVDHIGINASTRWKSIVPVSSTASILFNTRLTTGKSHATIWNQYKSLWIKRSIRHKVLRSYIVVPKGIQRSGEFRGAYLPSTTLNALDKKRQLKLGIK